MHDRVPKTISIVLLVFSITWVAWAFWPIPTHQASLVFTDTNDQKRKVNLIYPARLRPGEGASIRLEISPDGSQPVNGNESDHQIAEVRLVLPGGQVGPTESIRQPMLPGESLHYQWKVRAPNNSGLEGTIWLHVETIRIMGGMPERRAISAQPIQIETAIQPILPVAVAQPVSGILAISMGVVNFWVIGKDIKGYLVIFGR